jgi:hypothetical protein
VAKRSDLRELELRLDHKISETESRLKLWIVGQVFVTIGVLGTFGYVT